MKDLTFLNLITAAMGIAVSVFLLLKSNRNVRANSMLALCFFSLSYRSLSIFFIHNDLISNTFLMGYVSFVYYLIPPSFYLYFRQMSNDELKYSKKDWIHFVLPIAGALLCFVYMFYNYNQTGHFQLPTFKDEQIPFYFNPYYHANLLMGLSFMYCILSWQIILKYFKKEKNDHPQKQKVRKWLLTILVVCSVLILIVTSLILINYNFNEFNPQNIYKHNVLRSLVLFFLFGNIIYNSDLLFGLPQIHSSPLPVINQDKTVAIKQVPENETLDEKEELIENFQFDENGWIIGSPKAIEKANSDGNFERDKASKYIEQINDYLSKDPFINEDFNMKSISHHLEVPHYHIEFLFRYYNRFAFTEFRNILRVNYVIKKFENNEHLIYTIEGIGKAAGFSSRSSFFRVFKQITGKTPKQYAEDL
jgi:AraC-like DNA-binding protein